MASKAVGKKAASKDFAAAFEGLKRILKPYAAKMRVTADTPQWYSLETKEAVFRGRPCMFAAVRVGRAYVSYHLMSVYVDKAMSGKISPELKKRQQGKACFNFTAPDKKLFAEIKELTKAGAAGFVSGKYFEIVKTMKCD